jgi:hypothetical protein
MEQGPNSRFDLTPSRLDRVQFIFFLKGAGYLIEARVAGHGYLVVLASDAEAPIRLRTWHWAKYEKVFQLAALFVPARPPASSGATPPHSCVPCTSLRNSQSQCWLLPVPV